MAARLLQGYAIDARKRFARAHGDALYDALTGKRTRFMRLDRLMTDAAKLVPGLVPSAKEIAAEDGLRQGRS
jgi:(3,5-dihydroxyphenyl)acetyl-CoA 1,2-dioxygenase